MVKKITILVCVIVAGCSSSPESFLERDARELVRDADSHFEFGDYQEATNKYQKALKDFKVVVLHTNDPLELNRLILDTLEINNKLEIARIGLLME
jgi:outer membrane protein assembly factor BamD (BamD/ComL family)